jgi:small multidrug resistance pump
VFILRGVFLSYFYLLVAIVAEVVATSFLPSTAQFTKLWPSLITVTGYIIAFYCLSLCVREIPVGITYAIWCGFGIVLISLVGLFVYGQKLDTASLIGLGFIIAGIIIINIFSTPLHKS